ncbi:MAG: HlyD family efflux transporter periplasmic adaptor subunit [Planctomycetes bacterium]|nr:HlyD family efflux transporter periplasmic adaptor subunit [Planctomycetota bacterium]
MAVGGAKRFVRWFQYRGAPVVQVMVFLAAAGGAAMLFGYRSDSFSAVGLARGRLSHVSAVYDARIKHIPVRLYEKVNKGQVIAILDDAVVVGQIDAVSAEMARLRAEYAENQSLLDADLGDRLARWDAENRAFANDLAQLSLGLQELKAVLAYDRALLEGLRATMQSADQLVRGGLGPLADFQLAKAEYEATVKKIEENDRLAARLLAERQAAEERQAAHLQRRPVAPSQETAWEHLRQAVAVQQGLLNELEAQRAEYVLRAPFDGIVVEIQGRPRDAALQRPGEGVVRGPGEVVTPGDAVVTIAEGRPTEVVAFADSDQATRLRPGLEVELATTGPGRQSARSAVVAVGPTIQRLPESLWVDPRIPQWGRPFLVMIPPEMMLNAGDQVMVRKRWSAVRADAPAEDPGQGGDGRTGPN